MIVVIISEVKEQKKSKLSLILQNFPESTSIEASVQKHENTRNTPLFNDYVGAAARISNALQIGMPRHVKETLLTREKSSQSFVTDSTLAYWYLHAL